MVLPKENRRMIMDVLSRWNHYYWLNERFEESFRFLEMLAPGTPDGRHDIDGDNVYCMIQSYETKSREGQQFEAHRQYADIQMVLEGEESILWAPADGLETVRPYEPDIAFFALTPTPAELVLTPSVFCVFFPQDAHAPCLRHGGITRVRKAVVKVRIS